MQQNKEILIFIAKNHTHTHTHTQTHFNSILNLISDVATKC